MFRAAGKKISALISICVLAFCLSGGVTSSAPDPGAAAEQLLPTKAQAVAEATVPSSEYEVNLHSAVLFAQARSTLLQVTGKKIALEQAKIDDILQFSLPMLQFDLQLSPIGTDINALLKLQTFAGTVRGLVERLGGGDSSSGERASPASSGTDSLITLRPDGKYSLRIKGPDLILPADYQKILEKAMLDRSRDDLLRTLINYGHLEGSTQAVRTSVQFSIRQNILGNGSSLHYFRQKRNYDQAILQLRLDQQTAILKAISSYLDLYYQRMISRELENHLQTVDKLRAEAESLFKGLSITEEQVHQIRAAQLDLKQQSLAQLSQLRAKTASYRQLVGIIPKSMAPPTRPQLPSNFSTLHRNLQNYDHPRLAMVESDIDLQRITGYINPFLGYLQVNVSGGVNISWDLIRPEVREGELGMEGRIDLLPLRIIDTILKQKSIIKQRILLNINSNLQRKELNSAIKKLWLQHQSLLAVARVKREKLAILEQVVSDKKKKYSRGLISIFSLIENENKLFRAKLEFLATEKQLTLVAYQLLQVTGNLSIASIPRLFD